MRCLSLLLVALLTAAALHPAAAVSVVSASSLTACVNDGQFDATLNCTSKLVVTLAVEAGAALATSSLDFDVACVGSSTGACPCPCNAAADAACTCRDLVSPLRVTVVKTPAYATYPLTWVRSFNSKPTEAIIRTGVGWPSLTCADSATSAAPTCGWAIDYSGARVPDSQGFCCACSLDGLVGGTIGGGDGTTTRGGLNCDLLASFLIEPGSAHCLRHDPLWYEGYDLGGVQVDFDITVGVQRGAGPAATTTNITLSPATPAAAVPAVAARLLGDLSSYAPPPDFGGAMLFIPHPPGASLTAVLTTNTSAWMIVDKSMVSVDGLTCDRVGTSYAAFRGQAAACASRPGTCLANQLADLAAADAAAVAGGRPPRYSVTRWGGGQTGARQAFKRTPTGPLWLGLPLPSTTASLVTLAVDAANVTLVTNAAPARLVNGSVCAGREVVGGINTTPLTCGTFEALVSDATLAVTLVNAGVVDSDYVVAVANCTGAPVLPPAAQYVATRARESVRLSFDLHSTAAQAVDRAACTVTATDATGKLAAAVTVPFSVNATIMPPPPTDGGGAGDGGGGVPSPGPTCAQACPSWTEWRCRWTHRCWAQLGSAVAGVALGVAATALLVWGGVRGWWCRLVRCCLPRRAGAVAV